MGRQEIQSPVKALIDNGVQLFASSAFFRHPAPLTLRKPDRLLGGLTNGCVCLVEAAGKTPDTSEKFTRAGSETPFVFSTESGEVDETPSGTYRVGM